MLWKCTFCKDDYLYFGDSPFKVSILVLKLLTELELKQVSISEFSNLQSLAGHLTSLKVTFYLTYLHFIWQIYILLDKSTF